MISFAGAVGGRSSHEGTTILFGGGAKVCEIRVLNFYEIEVYSFEKNLGFYFFY